MYESTWVSTSITLVPSFIETILKRITINRVTSLSKTFRSHREPPKDHEEQEDHKKGEEENHPCGKQNFQT